MREFVVYVFFGVLSTLVNFAVFEGLELLLKPRWGKRSYLFSNIVAFVVALAFAFVVNKLFVFRSLSWERSLVLHEAWTFTAARLFSFGLEYLLTYVFFDLLWPRCEAWFTPLWQRVPIKKIAEIPPEKAFRLLTRWGCIAVPVTVSNYFFGKFVSFKEAP